MPTAKKRFQILNLHPKKQIFNIYIYKFFICAHKLDKYQFLFIFN